MRRLALFLPLLVPVLLFAWSPGDARSQEREPAGLLVRVVDAEGRPVAAATVQAGPEVEEESETTAVNRREETGAEGTVRFADLPIGESVWLLIEKKGFFPVARVAQLQPGEAQEIRVALLPGEVAVGRVVDEAGRPLAGVEVKLSGSPFGLWSGDLPVFLREKRTIRTRTGPAGRFRFRDLPEGEFDMVLRHPSHAPLRADRPVEGGRGGDLGRFVLRRGTTVTGRVTDPDGHPLAGVSIWALTEEWATEVDFPPPAGITGPDGTFSLPNLPGPPELYFCGPESLPGSQSVPFPEEPVHVTLRPGVSLQGRVLGPEGAPLARASIYADQIGVEPGCVRIASPCGDPEVAVADAEGHFSVGPLVPGWYDVRANAPGLVEGVAEKVRAAAGEPVEGIEIRMDTGGTLAGRVLDADGVAIAGATVMARSERTSAQGTSAADGSYRLAGIDDGPMMVVAQAWGYELLRQDLEPGTGARQADLVMARDSSCSSSEEVDVRGRVVGPGDLPIDGALVQTFAGQTWSAADGSFVLRAVSPDIWASKPGFAPGRARVALGSSPVQEVEIRLEAGSTVSGRVLGLLPEDRSRGTVHLGRDGESSLEGSIAPDGTFRVEHVPSGTWTLLAESGNRSANTSISLTTGSDTYVELELPRVHSVAGRVLDDQGLPVGGASLSLLADDFPRPLGSTRADGSFLLQLPDGSHQVRVYQEDFFPAGLEVRVDGAPVQGLAARLERGAILQGRILGLAPGEVPWVTGTRSSGSHNTGERELESAEVGVDGEYSLTNLRPGRWIIEVESPERGRRLHRMIEIPPGVYEIMVDLELPAAAETGTESRQ